MVEGETIIGPLVIVGGHEDKFGHPEILERIATLAHQHQPNFPLAVVTTASHEGSLSFSTYHNAFRQFGLEVFPLPIESRQEAELPYTSQVLAQSSGIFFTGGDQLRITSVLGGTPFHHALMESWSRGLVVAGTSAGASMMSGTMIVGGDAEQTPARNTVSMARGMGLWEDAVIDQHFSQRGRIGRLLAAVAQNPQTLGIGIDENTAAIVELKNHRLTVCGEGTVLVVDGQKTTMNNASEAQPGEPLTLTHINVHVLSRGYGLNLEQREPIRVFS